MPTNKLLYFRIWFRIDFQKGGKRQVSITSKSQEFQEIEAKDKGSNSQNFANDF